MMAAGELRFVETRNGIDHYEIIKTERTDNATADTEQRTATTPDLELVDTSTHSETA
jgi:hypothetical protein